MGPPFVLEPIKHQFGEQSRAKRIIYTKNEYNDKVKVENWQYSHPAGPRNPEENLGALKTTQERPVLSECLCENFRTTYQDMTDQLHLKDNYFDPKSHKHVFNYFGYSDDKVNPENFHARRDFPTILNNDHSVVPEFATTMQSSYAPPLAIIMQRLRSREERFMLYRRMKSIEDKRNNTKFRDDRVEEVNQQMRCARKGKYGISYNPMTGLNNDGSMPKLMSLREEHRLLKQIKH